MSVVRDLPRDSLIQYPSDGGVDDDKVGAAEKQIRSVNLEKTPVSISDTRSVDLGIQGFHQIDCVELISEDRRDVSANMAEAAEDEIWIQDCPTRGTPKDDFMNPIASKPRKAIRPEVEGGELIQRYIRWPYRFENCATCISRFSRTSKPPVRSKGRNGGVSKSRVFLSVTSRFTGSSSSKTQQVQ